MITLAATTLYGSLLAMLTIAMAMNVSRHRGRADKLYGHGDDQPLHRAIRAHGNNAEYVPLGVLMLALAELAGAGSMVMHAIGGTLLVGRAMSTHGILTMTRPTRAGGIVLTWVCMLAAAGYALALRFS